MLHTTIVLLCLILIIIVLALVHDVKRKGSTSHVIEPMMVYSAQLPKNAVTVSLYSDIRLYASTANKDDAIFVHTDAVYFDKLERSKENKRLICVTPHFKKSLLIFLANSNKNVQSLNALNLMENKLRIIAEDRVSELSFRYLLSMISDVDTSRISIEILGAGDAMAKYPGDEFVYTVSANLSDTSFFEKLSNFRLSLVDYNTSQLDVHKLAVIFPYAYLHAIDLRTLMPKQKDFTRVLKLFTTDLVCYSRVYEEKFTPHVRTFFETTAPLGDVKAMHSSMNFYASLGFKTYPIKESFVDPSQRVNMSVEVQIEGRMKLVVRNAYKRFVTSSKILGLELKVGDRVSLTGQSRVIENDTYVVVYVDHRNNSAYLDTALYLNWSSRHTELVKHIPEKHAWLIKVKYTHPSIEANRVWLKENDRVYVTEKDVGGYVLESLPDALLIQVTDELKLLETEYKCVTNTHLLTKEACLSDYDALGVPKTRSDIWDRRCKWDSECPFWDVNTYRGGCSNGYCEMPVGVKRVGYRKYDAKSVPYCKGCSNPDPQKMIECCKGNPFAFDLDGLPGKII